ncbi:MAG: aspartate/glutamate racemase family protein [Nitrosarchaeum sp.]|nr:aspartate/glutamate racemase family protein [Nitrosarchaeum sp.]
MARIAVFDSGLGSLSIIREIQKIAKSEIIYFGDQKNFPYGKKSKAELEKIICLTIKTLRDRFSPDLIVVGSNTPTLMLDIQKDIIGVRPPIREAIKISKTKNVGILGTKSAIQSRGMSKFIKGLNLDLEKNIHRINGSDLVELVETGKFLTCRALCCRIIRNSLQDIISDKNIDVITLSSTHLPFLRPLLEKEFPDVTFLDPARLVAKKIYKKIKHKQKRQNKLRIYTSGNVRKFQKNLSRLGIKNKVNFLSI